MKNPFCKNKCSSYVEAACQWLEFGFNVIPIVPGTKKTSVKWDSWLERLSAEKVRAHWSMHPDHHLGFIVGDRLVVLDADTPDAVSALNAVEETCRVTPTLVVKTRRGEHHYFRLADGTYARSDSHATERHPARLDIKTGRALVILPPSPGKEIVSCEVNHASALSKVGQDFIDAIFAHNGRSAPRPFEDVAPSACDCIDDDKATVVVLRALLKHLDPDCGYDDWLRVGMAIHDATEGSDEGLAIFDRWSRTGEKYKGMKETSGKWKTFRLDRSSRITISTLRHMVAANGHDVMAICSAAADPFDVIDAHDTGEGQ